MRLDTQLDPSFNTPSRIKYPILISTHFIIFLEQNIINFLKEFYKSKKNKIKKRKNRKRVISSVSVILKKQGKSILFSSRHC